MSPSLDAKVIASFCLSDPKYPDVPLGQTQHRINLVSKWDIKEGDNVLELGCGQGDCTAVLATVVGESGSVTALDPASLDYGTPFNLQQTHAHLRASAVGDRITFHRTDPLDFLSSATDAVYDVAVLAHCIWYFAKPSIVVDTLKALSVRAKRICIAEYALVASSPSAFPHVLAALAHASLECRKTEGKNNICTALTPKRIKEMATEAGLVLVEEGVLNAPAKMLDGQWEVSSVLGKVFEEELSVVKDEGERSVVEALRYATRASKEALAQTGVKVTTMDVWHGVFVTTTQPR